MMFRRTDNPYKHASWERGIEYLSQGHDEGYLQALRDMNEHILRRVRFLTREECVLAATLQEQIRELDPHGKLHSL